MRAAPWSAAAKLPPWNPDTTAVAGATALQGEILRFAQNDRRSWVVSIITES